MAAAAADAGATWSRVDADVAMAGDVEDPRTRPRAGAGAGADRLSSRVEAEEMPESTPVRDPFLSS